MTQGVTLDELTPGQRLRCLVPGRVVTVVLVTSLGDGLAEVAYRDPDGHFGDTVLTSETATRLEIVTESGAGLAFDGDPDEFRLAAEALRIKYAALYDPMVAVNSSDVEPLPHQIKAVYEELLPRVPLRYLLADDPGAGKTIMAGLYLKELQLHSDCDRALIVAPGGLVEQWREELSLKFGLRFEVFSNWMIDEAAGRNVFGEHPYLIARMDQLSRRDDLMEQLAEAHWDVAVVDEAHRMSAHYWAGEVDETKRFKLGRLLSETAQNLLLMTATPHAGKEDDFQLFMSLLDRDRFEGQYRAGVHHTDTTGLMRRMVKEDLLTFEGKPLFPERRAYTVPYELSDAEQELYEQVTEYVRTQMNLADQITAQGDRKRGRNIGFALTILQRRLASSPEAILRSLERRQDRLRDRLAQTQRGIEEPNLPEFNLDDFDDVDGDWSETEREIRADEVVDLATAAQTIGELQAEITILDDLITAARRVRHMDVDKKWVELRSILQGRVLTDDGTGSPRKIIIFTEHRDTLTYLKEKITGYLGRPEAVATIHGGTPREQRLQVREDFTENPDTVVLLATDAAGEGLNLQRAHLMVNYDLPWNPNRIEQRFGRIHRIGQKQVCNLWNLVAAGTREGEVFTRLLDKIKSMKLAYDGNLFNVLGEQGAFQEAGQQGKTEQRSLKDLLIEAIRYGDQPEVRSRLEQTIDASVADGLDELLAQKALHPEMYPSLNVEEVRRRMEANRERKLQPGYIQAFFIPAFTRLGGRVRYRESGRWQILRVPARVQDQARRANRWAPIPDQFERITFTTERIRVEAGADATLIAPGHPLLQAVIDLTITDLGRTLRDGTVFVDRRDNQDTAASLLFAVEQKIDNLAPRPLIDGDSPHLDGPNAGAYTVDRHFEYVQLSPNGDIRVPLVPPYLDYDAPTPDEETRIQQVLAQDWLRTDHQRDVRTWAYQTRLQPRLDELTTRMEADTYRVRRQVYERLNLEISHWDREVNRLADLERNGHRPRMSSKAAHDKARELEERLDDRMEQLDQAVQLTPLPARIAGCALVIPSRLLTTGGHHDPTHTKETEAVERRAVEAVLAAERQLGRTAQEMPHFNPGYDIRSTDHAGRVFFIEVKGRLRGSPTFTITANEVAYAQTQGDRHRLALVAVHPDDPTKEELRYIVNPFATFQPTDTTRSYNEDWATYWNKGRNPT
ncbi:MAG: DUF3883 domain-containing protein [Propionibacteriaceae bacterium]|jgi:superfamily II DNA or RNA helicase|nr:DUF3883 domain-containing protein [Propionibacteriaceae bacterium]